MIYYVNRYLSVNTISYIYMLNILINVNYSNSNIILGII